MKQRLLLLMALAVSALGFNANAQEKKAVDVTKQYLKNGDLSIKESGWTYAEGYKYEAWKTDGAVPVVEFYSKWNDGDPVEMTRKDFKFSQEVKLPAGEYRIAVNAFYRNGRGDGTNPDKAWIFAGEKTQNVIALDVYEPTRQGADGNNLNGLYSAALCFSEGQYSNEFDFTVTSDDAIEIGFAGYFDLSISWVILGPVKLLSYSLEAAKKSYEALLDEAKALANNDMNVSVSDALKKAMVDPESLNTFDALDDAVQALSDAIDAAKESIAAYKAFVDYVTDEVWTKYKDLLDQETEAVELLKEYLERGNEVEPNDVFPNGNVGYIISKGELTAEQLQKEREWLDKFITETLRKSLVPGSDLTDLLVNPKFTDGKNGWTGDAATGGLNTAPCLECYENTVDFYQVVEGVPDGIYSISCHAFERTGHVEGNDDCGGEFPIYPDWPEISATNLFMNDFQTPVQTILQDKLPVDEAENTKNCYIEETPDAFTGSKNLDKKIEVNGESYYIPDGMKGASYAFKTRYVQKVYGLVEGGTMKIGLTSNGKKVHWVLWTDFALTYEGKTAEAVAEALDALIGSASDFMGNEEIRIGETITTVQYDILDKALTAAGATLKDSDIDEMWNALIALNKALADAKENVTVLEEFYKVQEELEDAYQDASDEAYLTDEADNLYNGLQDEMGMVDNLTTAELKDLVKRMKWATGYMKVPAGYEDASDDNEFDMTFVIVNPSFETGDLTGWKYNKASNETKVVKVYEDVDDVRTPIYDANQANGYSTYFVENADGHYLFNTWSGSVPSGGFWLAQTITGLPAGTYEISALVASDAGREITLETDTHRKSKATITIPELESDDEATEGDDEADEPAEVDEDENEEEEEKTPYLTVKNIGHRVSNIFVIEEGAELEIKLSAMGWFKADDFKLTYYGKDSEKIATDINTVEPADDAAASAPVAIYTLAGTKVSSMQKGINIVKYANGKVAKVLVK